jgi:hypothetical protein
VGELFDQLIVLQQQRPMVAHAQRMLVVGNGTAIAGGQKRLIRHGVLLKLKDKTLN